MVDLHSAQPRDRVRVNESSRKKLHLYDRLEMERGRDGAGPKLRIYLSSHLRLT